VLRVRMNKIQKRATIEDVAKLAGVSTATVSRVVNQTGQVTEKTTQRVRAAIAEINYLPSAGAKSLASRKTNTIGLLSSDISVPFFGPILRGIESEATRVGYGLLISCTQSSQNSSKVYDRYLGPHNTDGLLVFAGTLSDEELGYLVNIGFPLVLLHQSSPAGLSIPSVTVENKDGTYSLVNHLIEVHGCQRIAFLRGPENHQDSYWRELGYRESLKAHSLPYDPHLIGVGAFNQLEAYQTVKDWLANGLEFDAVFGGDDEGAIGAITALREAGQRVPEDVAVVGFDDIHLAHYLIPALTTVRAPIEQAGQQAVKQLVRQIEKEIPDPITMLPTELVIRSSCGCSSEQEVLA